MIHPPVLLLEELLVGALCRPIGVGEFVLLAQLLISVAGTNQKAVAAHEPFELPTADPHYRHLLILAV